MVLENLHETVARPHAIALKLRPNRGPAQGVWSHAPARHYLWVRPDLFFSGEAHTCRMRSHRRCLPGRSWSRSSLRDGPPVQSSWYGAPVMTPGRPEWGRVLRWL